MKGLISGIIAAVLYSMSLIVAFRLHVEGNPRAAQFLWYTVVITASGFTVWSYQTRKNTDLRIAKLDRDLSRVIKHPH